MESLLLDVEFAGDFDVLIFALARGGLGGSGAAQCCCDVILILCFKMGALAG